jgi:hypothetical protein
MKIAFNCLDSGLGNNGGSRTILYCTQILRELGHTCHIIATSDKFTWFPHPKPEKYIPENIDWLIATACSSVPSTIKHHCKNKAWYIRAHETWHHKFGKEEILGCFYQDKRLLQIVNSIWQQEYLFSKYNVKAHLIYQGIDLHIWEDLGLRTQQSKLTIGCLYTEQPRKRWVDFVTLSKILGHSCNYVAYGPSKPPKESSAFLTQFLSNPSFDQLKELYSSCHYWFAPTNSEGLHNVPMEASLCGASIICSDSERNGMKDYASPQNAFIYTDTDIATAAGYIKTFGANPPKVMIQLTQQIVQHKIGDRRTNMKKFIKVLETYQK